MSTIVLRSRILRQWVGVLCLSVLVYWVGLPAQKTIAAERSLLVGIYLNRQEVDSLEILEVDDGYLVPLESVAQLIKVGVQTNADQTTTLTTPLGQAIFQPTELEQIKGVVYVRDRLLRDRLALQIRFSARDYALFLEVPWQLGAVAADKGKLNPDFRPPNNGLSRVRSATSIGASPNNLSLGNTIQAEGKLAGGTWQVQADYANLLNKNDAWVRPRFSQYFYQNEIGSVPYRIGKQQIQLHPLLANIAFTGGQVALTNQPNRLENDGSSSLSGSSAGLLSRRSRPSEAFRGNAPPASIVQLRIDNIVVEQQQTRLNGEYEFLDVPLEVSGNRQIEIFIFDRKNLRVPIETRQITLNASDLLLPKTAVTHLFGAGLSGNLLDEAVSGGSGSQTGQPIAFYQWRQGMSDNLTVEAAVQKTPETFQAQTGMVWRFAKPWVLDVGAGLNHRGDLAYVFNLSGTLPHWRIQLNSEFTPQTFETRLFENDRNTFNHSLDVSYRVNRNLSVGAIARRRQDSEGLYQYLLPTFSWRPHPNLSFQGRPDNQGQYYYNANYSPSRRSELSLSGTTEAATLDLRYDISDQYQLNLGTDLDRALSPRYFAVLTRGGRYPRDPSIGLGVSMRDGAVGLIANASLEPFPGILTTLQYQSQNRSLSGSGGNDQSLQILISTDFTVHKGRFHPVTGGQLNSTQGAIAGRLILEKSSRGSSASQESLEGSLVTATLSTQKRHQLNQLSTYTDAAGNFSFGSLPSGIYVLELTPEKLPIQYTPTKTRVITEVKVGSITQVEYILQSEYGLAGRVVDLNQNPISGLGLELMDGVGKRIATAVTDEFGLYRLDRIRSGRYTLKIAENSLPKGLQTSPIRPIDIQQDFLFGQDLQLPL